jgi:hypothetical protein
VLNKPAVSSQPISDLYPQDAKKSIGNEEGGVIRNVIIINRENINKSVSIVVMKY